MWGIDWYCDNCGAYLNDQEDFDEDIVVEIGSWECTECGYENDTTLDNVRWPEGCSAENPEGISVETAAEIWNMQGRDDFYTFGYCEDELLDALGEYEDNADD